MKNRTALIILIVAALLISAGLYARRHGIRVAAIVHGHR
jgi:hypothetical protein